MTFIIYRPYWRRGSAGSQLLDDFGTMCCLGHVAVQCGINEIFTVATPSGVPQGDYRKWPEALRPKMTPPGDATRNSRLVSDLMNVNDLSLDRVFTLQSVPHDFDTPRHWGGDMRILHTEDDRERVLTALAARSGITLVFTDDPNDLLVDVDRAHTNGIDRGNALP